MAEGVEHTIQEDDRNEGRTPIMVGKAVEALNLHNFRE